MKTIAFSTWKRREHYAFFEKVDYPQFNVCMNLDVTHFKRFVSDNHLSFYYSLIYTATETMNAMEDFRYKIRNGQIVLHDQLYPSFTDLGPQDELFKIVTTTTDTDIRTFSSKTRARSAQQQTYFPPSEFAQDELIYFSCLPWISFTSLSNEWTMDKEDSTPRLSFGKYFEQGKKLLLPFSIQVNHLLLDGQHVGKYTKNLQLALDSFQKETIV